MPPASPGELLSDLAAALDALNTRWYVFGAQAAILWGRPRLTADVDVTIDAAGRPTAVILEVLSRSGFTLWCRCSIANWTTGARANRGDAVLE